METSLLVLSCGTQLYSTHNFQRCGSSVETWDGCMLGMHLNCCTISGCYLHTFKYFLERSSYILMIDKVK